MPKRKGKSTANAAASGSKAISQTTEGRMETQKKLISGHTKVPVRQLEHLFGNASYDFWLKLKKLADTYFPRFTWEDIYKVLQLESAKRHTGQYRSCKASTVWAPADVTHTTKSLDTRDNEAAGPSSPMSPPADALHRGPGVHVVFCGIGDPETYSIRGESGVRSLEIFPTDPFQGGVIGSLTPDDYERLELDVGESLCSNTGRKDVHDANEVNEAKGPGEPLVDVPEGADAAKIHIHSVIITLLWAEKRGNLTVEFHGWDWLKSLLESNTLSDHLSAFDKPVLLFTHMRRPHRTEQNWTDVCNFFKLEEQVQLANEIAIHGVAMYPSAVEQRADRRRMFDIKCLDEIAKDAPEKFSFRPKVCYASSTSCQMADYEGQMIVRGSSNTGPGDTLLASSDDPSLTRLLKCRGSRPGATGGKHHFHQELNPTTTEYGEISVILVADTVSHVGISRGAWTDQNSYHSGLTADRCFTHWSTFDPDLEDATEKEAMANQEDLYEFALYQRKQLLQRWPDEFETAKVGVRLDIGISKLGKDAQFFVLDVWRWPGADMLSAWLPGSAPYEEIAKSMGKRFAVLYGTAVGDDQQSDEDAQEKGPVEQDGNEEEVEGQRGENSEEDSEEDSEEND